MDIEKEIKAQFVWMKKMIRQGNHTIEDGLDLLESRVLSLISDYLEEMDELADSKMRGEG